MDSRLSQQLATIRATEALEQADTARAARDVRPGRTRKPPRIRARIVARVAHR
jgi:hypothetical protein